MYPKELFSKCDEIDYQRFTDIVIDEVSQYVVSFSCPLFGVFLYRLDGGMSAIRILDFVRYKGEKRVSVHCFFMELPVGSLRFAQCVDWYLKKLIVHGEAENKKNCMEMES